MREEFVIAYSSASFPIDLLRDVGCFWNHVFHLLAMLIPHPGRAATKEKFWLPYNQCFMLLPALSEQPNRVGSSGIASDVPTCSMYQSMLTTQPVFIR